MGPKPSLESVFYSLKSPYFGGGSSGMFMASNVVQVTVISGWNGLGASMGPGGHIQSLDLVIGAMKRPRWVQNHRWGGYFLA